MKERMGDTITLPRIQKPEDTVSLIDAALRALDTYEGALERGVGRLHAMEMVLLQDRDRP